MLPRLSDVPTPHLRRALNFLVLLRASAPEWAAAFLDDVAYPYFRPDIPAPAYYEFPVRSATGAPAGFIIVSTAEHDYPLAHWKPEGASLAAGLLAAANGRALTFYKLDALTYGAETPDGQQLIRAEGAENPLLKIAGLQGVDLNSLQGTFEWTPGPDPVVDGGVNNMQIEIRSYIGGFCLGSAGPTWPWNMGGAYLYPQKRAWAWMAVVGGHNFINNEWQHIADAIELWKTPGIILTGSFASAHYPLIPSRIQRQVFDKIGRCSYYIRALNNLWR